MLSGRAADFVIVDRPDVVEGLRDQGLVVVQLDEPLTRARFLALGASLGEMMPETDPAVLPYVEHRMILNLVSDGGRTSDVARQPFSTNALTLHSEGSGRGAVEQPRFIVLMCCDPGDAAALAQTVLVPMTSVARRLTAAQLATLAQTRYRTGRVVPALVREVDSRRVFSFRDFSAQALEWTYTSDDGTDDDVNGAIRALLAAMYASEGASGLHWRRGTLVVIDNTFWFHGRTAGAATRAEAPRHLRRLRIRARDDGRGDDRPLFASVPEVRRLTAPQDAVEAAAAADGVGFNGTFAPFVDDRLLDLFASAHDPTDALELRDLWLGRVEHELGRHSDRPGLAERWRETAPRRAVDAEEILVSRATVRLVKEMFNWFFRDDLYGELRSDGHTILSSGSVDEVAWGLPGALKDCVRYALERDWYGYSDSRGREPAREAIAAYESERIVTTYGAESVALTTGGTSAMSSLSDFVLLGRRDTAAPALCAIPNYPPLVEAVARRSPVRLVPLPSEGASTSLEPLVDALEPGTPLVMLQTVVNPTGARIPEAELERLIRAASPSTMILVDECHEWLGPAETASAARAAPNVVRVSSLSKVWSAPGMKIGWILADPAFIGEYYEYASTTFGGPPSVFATLVEVVARMEQWRLAGVTPGAPQVAEFDPAYAMTTSRLSAAFDRYHQEWVGRQRTLTTLRDAAVAGFSDVADVVPPRYSINATLILDRWDDSYLCFRDLLRETGVAVFPGLLTFCLSGGVVRVTTGRPWPELSSSIERLKAMDTTTVPVR